MSKFFDALSKAQGEVAAMALPLIDRAGSAGVAAEPRGRVHIASPSVASPSLYPIGPPKIEPKHIGVEEVHVKRLDRVVFHTDPDGPAADRFRLLQMRLREFWRSRNLSAAGPSGSV